MADRLENVVRCPWCSCELRRHLFEEKGFPYVECLRCGLIYLAVRIQEDKVMRLYNHEAYYSKVEAGAALRNAKQRLALVAGERFRGASHSWHRVYGPYAKFVVKPHFGSRRAVLKPWLARCVAS